MKRVERRNLQSGTPWEPVVGYCRAVKVGPHVFVAGTTATNEDGSIVGKGDLYLQTKTAIQNIERALRNAGASLSDVVRTRVYVTDIREWEKAGKAHGEFFGPVRPATTMVEVSRLVLPDMLVEVEAEAIIVTEL